jgi:hypothetical protein
MSRYLIQHTRIARNVPFCVVALLCAVLSGCLTPPEEGTATTETESALSVEPNVCHGVARPHTACEDRCDALEQQCFELEPTTNCGLKLTLCLGACGGGCQP